MFSDKSPFHLCINKATTAARNEEQNKKKSFVLISCRDPGWSVVYLPAQSRVKWPSEIDGMITNLQS